MTWGVNMEDNGKKTVVSEEVDKFINSLALSITFITLGILLTVIDDFMGDATVTSVTRWVFVVLGTLGFASSFGNEKSGIKGMGDISMGLAFLFFALLVFWLAPKPFGGVGALLILLIGVYGMLRGVIYFAYTTYHAIALASRRAKAEGRRGVGDIVVFLLEVISKLAALALVVAQIYQIYLGLA